MSLESLWLQLSSDPDRPQAGYLSRRVGVEAPCDLHAAIEFPSGNRALLVGVPAAPLARAGPLPRSAGIETRQIATLRPRPGMVTVAVRLADARYTDVFTVVAEDITRHLGSVVDGPSAAAALVTRLRKWQQFLDRHSPEGLGPLARQGLYGELRLLQLLLVTRIGARAAVEAWVGPQAANQDFQFPASAVEVKTSTAKMHQMLEIASERQLDAAGLVHLFMFHLSLDERRGGGETLPGLVASIRAALVAEFLAAETFESRLLDAGYLDIHASQYVETGYSVRDTNFFRVSDNFPRIIEADLRAGVGAVRYSVSVAECMHFRVEVAAVIDEMVGGMP
jgi:Putative  PD-(D/E)XK family member, (DUF4420)